MDQHRMLWLAVVILSAFCMDVVAAEEFLRLPSVDVGVYQQGNAPRVPEFAMGGHQPERIEQVTHFAQSEMSGVIGPFVGPTSVDVLVQYALANNPEIQAVRYQAAALGARVPQARSLPDPQLMTTVFLEEIQTAAGPQEVAMTLAQKFPWFGKLALRSQVAYQNSMAAYARVTATELKVVEQVKKAYFDVYFAQNAIIVTRRLKQPLVVMEEVSQARYVTDPRAGMPSVFQVQIERANLEKTLIGFEGSLRAAQARLAGVLHLPAATRIEVKVDDTRPNLAHTAETLVGLVESCQPELEAWRREIGRDRYSIGLARREYWPDVTLGMSWYEMGGRGLSPVANGRDAYSLAVGVNLPIYRTRLDAAVREAQYKASASTRRYETARDRFQAEVDELYARFREQDLALKVLKIQIIPPAEQTLELSMESYRASTLEFQQLIDAFRTLLSAQIDFHKRTALREQLIASLERAVGCGITSVGLEAVEDSEMPVAPLPPPVQ